MIWVATAMASSVSVSALAGGRSAPESTLLVPAEWEKEPSGLVALTAEGVLGEAGAGPWLSLGGTGWAYAPDTDVAMTAARLGTGFGAKNQSISAYYDAELYPLLPPASSLRGSLVGTARAGAWGFGALVVDRRFLAVPAASFSSAEGHVAYTWKVSEATSVLVQVGGQANEAGAVGGEGAWGAQARGRLGLSTHTDRWTAAVDYQPIVAFEGESEQERVPAFTPLGDYEEDVDALSGGGFVQHRFGINGAVTAGAWIVSADAALRLRDAEEEEERSTAYARIFSGRVTVRRTLTSAVELFASAGADSAAVASGPSFVDAFGWVGVRYRADLKKKPPSGG